MSEHENPPPPPPTPPEVWVTRDYLWPQPVMRWTRGGSWWCRLMHKRWHRQKVWMVRPNPLDLRHKEYGWTTLECTHCPPGRI